MLSENANVVKPSPHGRGGRFVHQLPADDGGADGEISDPIFGKRQQIILQDNKISPFSGFDRTFFLFLEGEIGAIERSGSQGFLT